MTPERLQEIRDLADRCRLTKLEKELLEEIDRLKQDMHLVVSDAGKGLIKERYELLKEKEERNKWIIAQGEIVASLKAENEKLKEENRKERYKHASNLIQGWTLEDYEKENQCLKVRIQNLKQALVFWLSSTPTNQEGKYDEIKNWHAARAQEVLEQDSQYEKEFAAHWKECLAEDDQEESK